MLDFKVFMSRMGGGKSLIYNHLGRIHTDSLDTLGPLDGVFPRPAGLSVCLDNPFIYRSVMKKVLMFASAAIAALAMVSCNKEIEIQDQIAEGICPDGYYIEELEATYPVDPATRTAFNETSGKFAWTEGDELAFHLSNGTYTSAPIDPATSKVKLYLPVGVTRDNYAVYPASAVVDEAAEVGNMQVTLPSTYDISDNLTTEFVPMPLIATNDADNKKLKFEHVGALLQVNLNVPAGVKTATLSMGKTITGTFDLAAGSGNGIIEAGAVSDDALTFILSEEGLADVTTVKLLAPLPSGTYEKFEVAYDDGFAFTKDLSSNPWEFDRTYGKKVSIGEDKFVAPNYFWFEALEAGSTVSFKNSKRDLYYSLDKRNWTKITDSDVITLENIGDRVWFYATGNLPLGNYYNGFKDTTTGYVTNKRFTGTGKLKCGGELAYLWKKGQEPMVEKCFLGLFAGMGALVDASEIIYPEGIAENCYYSMFDSCVNMEYGPSILPEQSLSKGCYERMFFKCSKLTTPPALPATILASRCYTAMFWGCSSLSDISNMPQSFDSVSSQAMQDMYDKCSSLTSVILPEMHNIGDYALDYMFQNCTSLTSIIVHNLEFTGSSSSGFMLRDCSSLSSIEVHFTEWSKIHYDWVSGVSSTGNFYMPVSLSKEYGSSRIPTGWTVYNLEEVGAGI